MNFLFFLLLFIIQVFIIIISTATVRDLVI
jgi:hypothetical protein